MGKKRVAWNRIRAGNQPGFSCDKCHGEGKTRQQELNKEGRWVSYDVYCTCYQGQCLKKANKNLVLRSH